MTTKRLSKPTSPNAIRADELMPKLQGQMMQFMRNGRLLTGEFRQLSSIGLGGEGGIFVNVLLEESELWGDLFELSEGVVGNLFMAEIQLDPDTEIFFSFAAGSAGAASIGAAAPKMITL